MFENVPAKICSHLSAKRLKVFCPIKPETHSGGEKGKVKQKGRG